MEPLEWMAIASILGNLISVGSEWYQQNHEFGQQKQLLSSEQAYQSKMQALMNGFNLPSTAYYNYLDLGFNPNLAADSVLGGNSVSASSASSPSAPSVNSAIGALSSLLGKSTTDIEDIYLKQAQIGNLDSQSNKNQVEAGLMPRDYELRRLSTNAQLLVWNKSVDKMTSEIGYNKEMTDLVRQQNMYYGRMSEAQIKSYQAQAAKDFQNVRTQLAQISLMKHQANEIDAKSLLEGAQTTEAMQRTANLQIENYGQSIVNARNKIAMDFESKLQAPLTADAKDKLRVMIKDGKVDDAEQFLNVIFQSSLNQSLGVELSKPAHNTDFSFGVGNLLKYSNSQRNYPKGSLNGWYGGNVPYWNPPKSPK